jgi:hypothetical protein
MASTAEIGKQAPPVLGELAARYREPGVGSNEFVGELRKPATDFHGTEFVLIRFIRGNPWPIFYS